MLQNGRSNAAYFKLENQTLLSVNGLIILELIIREAECEGADSDLTYLTPI
jgi:hypothetical protein